MRDSAMIGTLYRGTLPVGRLLLLTALAAMLLLASSPRTARGESLALHYIEPFTVELPAAAAPPTGVAPGFPEPICATAALGETTTVAVVGLRGMAELGTITVRAGTADGPGGQGLKLIEVFLVKGLPRNNRYINTLLGAQQLAALAPSYPDILLSDEPLFDRRASCGTSKRLASQLAGDRVTASLGNGQVKYLLVRVAVPPDLDPGSYRTLIGISAEKPGLDLTVPVLIKVLPFPLPPHGKVLRVANDFASPSASQFAAALEDQAAHGMTATRLVGVLKGKNRDRTTTMLQDLGFTHLVHRDEPKNSAEAGRRAGSLRQFFYGVDEPQPKSRRLEKPWSRMADHVKLSRKIHGLGGLVTTSIPYPFAMQLAQRDSELYTTLHDYGLPGVFEPLDWANYGLGLQRIGLPGGERAERSPPGRRSRGGAPGKERSSAWNQELFDYIRILQADYNDGRTRDGRTPLSKHNWLECYYFPLGYFKSPFYARLLFGYYLFNSRLDGVAAWTLFRPRGNPFTDDDGEDPVIAYPGKEGMIPTYWWEAVREGVNDLRYCTLAENLLIELKKTRPDEGRRMAVRLQTILTPFKDLAPGGTRIDRTLTPAAFRRARSELVSLIKELQTLSRKPKAR